MSERDPGTLSGTGVQYTAPKTDGVEDLTREEVMSLSVDDFEKRLDGIFGKKKPETDLSGIAVQTEQNSEGSENSLGKRLVAAATVGTLLGGAGIAALSPTEARAETAVVTEGTVPSESGLEGYEISTPAPGPEPVLPTPTKEDAEYAATIAALESLGYSTEHYAERQMKINEYKDLLRANECQEINLEACANWIYSIKNSTGFSDNAFKPHPEKTVLSNYVTVDQVIEFGRTGKVDKNWNWKVIYHKDEKGKKTKEPGLMYAFNPENKVFSDDAIQDCIDTWEQVAPGFFRVMNKNDEWVFLQSDACDPSNKIQAFKYGDGIIYCNYSSRDLDDFKNFLTKMGLGKEQYGVKGDALWGSYKHLETGMIKARLALDCCKYIFQKTGSKFIANRIISYQMEVDNYNIKDLESAVNDLIFEIKSKNLMTPYGADTWAEIDAVVNADSNATAKADEGKTN